MARMLTSEARVPGLNPSAALILFTFLKSEAKNSKFHYFRIFTKLLNNLSNKYQIRDNRLNIPENLNR